MNQKPTYKELEKKVQALEHAEIEHKQVEKALVESEEKWRNILANIPQIGISINPQARIIFANDHLLTLTGWKAQEVIGQDWFDMFIPANKRQKVRKVFGQIMRQKDTFGFSTYENDIVTRAGELRNVLWSNVLTKDFQGNVLNVNCLGIDLTERKKAEEALERMHALLEAAINQSPSGILIADAPDVRIRLANPAAFGIRGGDENQLTGIDVEKHSARWQVFHPDGTPYDSENLPLSRAILKGEISKNVEVIIRHESGKERWVSANAAPIKNSSGIIQAGIVVFHDITGRKQVESALYASEEKFRTLVEKSPLGIALIAEDGRYKYVNPQFSTIFGYTLDDIPNGKTWFKQSFPDQAYRQKVIKTWLEDKKQIDGGQARPRTFTVTCKDGSRKKIHFRPVTMENRDQFMICEDITEKSRMERQLQQAQKFEAIGTLAGGIAHDFNNLLMGIQGRASLMAVELAPSHSHLEHIHSIEACIRSATGLTKQLLGFARGGKYEVKPININKLVLNNATMFSRTRKEIDIHTNMRQSPLIVEADQGQIDQVLLNMYVNAWQAMPDGGELYLETAAVMLDDDYCKPYAAKAGPYAKVSVTDTGAGMNEDTRRRIFDPFFTTKDKNRGTGLGLASAYGIIKNHGGMITVYSERNHGTTFNIYLPISEKEMHPEMAAEGKMDQGSETILLVDDEAMIIDVGQAILKKLGYRVVVSQSGLEAVEKIKALGNEIDLVLLDLIMPGMDGGKTFHRIREIHPQMPVLLASGYAVNGLATEILRKGCNGFIQKPFNIAELSQKIRNVLDEANGSGKS